MLNQPRFLTKLSLVSTIAICALATSEPTQGFNTDTHSALTLFAAENHPQSKVNDFLKHQLLEANGLNSIGQVLWWVNSDVSRTDWRYSTALCEGARDEDAENGLDDVDKAWDGQHRMRFVRHFYDPSRHGQGLNDPGVPWQLLNLPQGDSLHWAWDNNRAVPTTRGLEDYSWNAARRHYLFWLKHPDRTERQRHAGETFYALGHVVHLVQDLAQPQHTRNDAHAPWYIGGDSAPFEKYCSSHYSSDAQIASLPRDRVPVFEKLPRDQHDGIPPEFRAFWDTHQIFGDPINRVEGKDPMNHPDPHSLGLAEFSNAYFVTDDTMFTGRYPVAYPYPGLPKGYYIFSEPRSLQQQLSDEPHRFFYPRLTDLVNLGSVLSPNWTAVTLVRAGELSMPGFLWQTENLVRHKPNIPEFCSGFVGSGLFLGITDKNREAHARFLLPKAIAYSTGLLNYFFRGRLKMEFLYPEEGTPNPQPQIKITNLTFNDTTQKGEGLTNGFFTLLRENPVTTNRTVVWDSASADGYSGSLPFGHSFTSSIPANLLRDGKLILVFQGTIGNEKDIGVAAVAMPVACDNYVLLANGSTNGVFQWGDTISFTRYRINADGTRTEKPLLITSPWSWVGSPNVAGDGRGPFMPELSGLTSHLIALRRGKWKLQPNDGGCVEVEVKGDGVLVRLPSQNQFDSEMNVKRAFTCSVGGVSVGAFKAFSQYDPTYSSVAVNELSRQISDNRGWGLAFRIPEGLRPGDRLLLQNTSVGTFSGGVPSTDPIVRFFGGITPELINPYLFTREPWEIPLNVPPVPGDEDEPPAPPPPGLP